MKRIVALSVATLSLGACSEPMSPGWRIEDSRVLGARLEVDAQPEISTPAPGETVHVDMLLALPPTLETTVNWAFLSCVKRQTSTGLPLCLNTPSLSNLITGQDAPAFDLGVPNMDGLMGQSTMLVQGIVCEGGTPAIDMSSGTPVPGCSAGSTKSTIVALDVEVAVNGVTNNNPSLSAAPLTFDDVAWSPLTTEVPAIGCASLPSSAELPRVQADTKAHALKLDATSVMRDMYTRTISGSPPIVEMVNEQLQFSHFASDGNLERQFDIIERDAEIQPDDVAVKWDAQEESDALGERVDFYFVVRDGRGGTDWLSRSVCVVGTGRTAENE